MLQIKVRVLNSLKRVPFHYMRVYSSHNLMPQTGTGKKTNVCEILREHYMRETSSPCWKHLLYFILKTNRKCTRSSYIPYFIWIFPMSTGLAPNRYDYMRFPIRIWLNYVLLRWAGAFCQSKPVYLGALARTHTIQIFIYGGVHYRRLLLSRPLDKSEFY